MICEAATRKSIESKTKIDEVTLTVLESKRLIGICIELIDLCAKATGKFDPAMGTMVAFARDQALTDAIGIKR
jgi:hypothetical protein